MQKTISALAVILLGAVFFIPTFISESLLFPFISGKNLLFRGLVFLALICLAYLVYSTRKLRTYTTPMHKAFAFFVGTLAVSGVFAQNATRSFWSNFERMEGWFTIFTLGILFFLLYQLVENSKTWRNIALASLVANGYIIFFALSQYFGFGEIFQGAGSRRPDSTLGNSSYLGGYALMYVFIIAWLFLQTKNLYSKIGYGALIVLNFAVMALTLTRGSLVGFLAGLFVCLCITTLFFFIKRNANQKDYKKLIFAPIALGVLLLSASLFVANRDSAFVESNRVLDRIATISIQDKSVEGRFINWGVSWEGFKERPLLGWGQDNFLYVFSKYFDPRMAVYEPWYDRSHNVFFDWLIAGGIFGLVGYLSLYAISIWILWFRKNAREVFTLSESTLWTGFLVAYFTHNFFVFDNIASYVLFTFFLAYITWKSYQHKQTLVSFSENNAKVAMSIFLAIGIMGLFFLVYKPVASAKALIEGMQYSAIFSDSRVTAEMVPVWSKQVLGKRYSSDELSAFIRSKFEKAANYPLGRTEAREQLGTKLISIIQSPIISNEEKTLWVEFVLSELGDEITQDPQSARTYQLVANIYMQLNQAQQAIPLLEKAQSLSPKKQLIMFDRALAYQIGGDYQKTLEIVKETYELNQNFPNAHELYIAALYRVGDDVEAQKEEILFKEKFTSQNNTLNEQRLFSAKVDFLVSKAVQAYEAKDMATYNGYVEQVRALSSEVADRLVELMKSQQG